MRVGILSLMHESNTFLPVPTTVEDFRRHVLATGDDVARHWRGKHHEVSGFLEGLEKAGATVVPLFSAWAMPGGIVTADAYVSMLATMLEQLDKALPLDGLLVAPHGAGVSEKQRDMDGHWLSQVRAKVGPGLPMMCTADPHMNLTPRIVESCQATIAYRTNPHTDQKQIGLQAADLLVRTVRGEINPTQAATYPPIVINIERQVTAQPPCRLIYDVANAMLERPGVLSNSIVLGFSYADVVELGTSAIVVTDGDPALAQRCADELAEFMWEHRRDYVAELVSINDALDRALEAEAPVCLLDMGDNVGGGSPGDSTFLAHAMHDRSIEGSFISLQDPEAAAQAEAAGPGATVELTMGGKTDDAHGEPFVAPVTVRSLHDGEFFETQVRHGGKGDGHMGRTAVVVTQRGMTIQLTTHRTAPFSLEQVRSCDLDPASLRILVAKGVVAPVAAYEEVCKTFIRVNTAGSTSADLSTFRYAHRRKPLFPFEDVDWKR